jgi:hypothetical protein
MDVNDGGAGFEGFVGGFDLFRRGYRQGGIVFFARNGACNGNGDDDGSGHVSPSRF